MHSVRETQGAQAMLLGSADKCCVSMHTHTQIFIFLCVCIHIAGNLLLPLVTDPPGISKHDTHSP